MLPHLPEWMDDKINVTLHKKLSKYLVSWLDRVLSNSYM